MNKIPNSIIVLLALLSLLTFLIPLVLAFILKKKKPQVKWASFLVGCVIMFVFALVIESSLHNIILGSSIGPSIINNAFLYALYGGFMAALFEESGRYIAFEFLLKKERETDENSLMYGLGHGGIEMILLYSLSMVSNIVLILMINSGVDLATLAPGENGQALAQVSNTLLETHWSMYLLGFFERISALIAQVSLSIFVWMGVKHKQFKYVLYAFLGHFLLDFVTAYLSRSQMVSMYVLEIIIFVGAILLAFFARSVWKKLHQEVSNDD